MSRTSRDPYAQVVRVEDGELGDARKPVGAVGVEVGERAHRVREVRPERAHRADRLRAVEVETERQPVAGRPAAGVVDFGVAHDDRRRQVIDQMRGDAERAGARAAAAVRDRKRLVQVEVHEVEAHVAGPRVAHERVGVGAVVVHQAAGGVHRRRDLVRSGLRTSPSVFGLVIMQTAVSGPTRLARSPRALDAAALVRLAARRPCSRPSPPTPGSCRARCRGRSPLSRAVSPRVC